MGPDINKQGQTDPQEACHCPIPWLHDGEHHAICHAEDEAHTLIPAGLNSLFCSISEQNGKSSTSYNAVWTMEPRQPQIRHTPLCKR